MNRKAKIDEDGALVALLALGAEMPGCKLDCDVMCKKRVHH